MACSLDASGMIMSEREQERQRLYRPSKQRDVPRFPSKRVSIGERNRQMSLLRRWSAGRTVADKHCGNSVPAQVEQKTNFVVEMHITAVAIDTKLRCKAGRRLGRVPRSKKNAQAGLLQPPHHLPRRRILTTPKTDLRDFDAIKFDAQWWWRVETC